jgi:mono/diheme cytochrome c family protein
VDERNGRLRLLLAAALFFGAPAATAGELSAQEASGKRIFNEGTSASGAPITARIGMMSQKVPASAVPCASCHGEDGKGQTQGGKLRPDITWEQLADPEGHDHQSGRSHPAFTEDSFAAAVSRGVDPAGNRLDPTMPRYDLSKGGLADLIAYLKRL